MEKKKEFSLAERRWLVREIYSGRMLFGEVKELIGGCSKNPDGLLRFWMKRYAPSIDVTLPVMTEKERQKVEDLQKKLKALEKQLEDAQMKNIALETMIDIAEEQLKITIRKKSGPKR